MSALARRANPPGGLYSGAVELINTTKHQHYLPQVEQRLNAANPRGARDRQRIYSFKLVDREQRTLQLENPKGRLISENLAIRDLFSFDVAPDNGLRANFETLFGRYEGVVKATTVRVLDRLKADGAARENGRNFKEVDPSFHQDLKVLFTAKILNFARNPYCVEKVLNTFGVLANYEPTCSQKRAYFERILNGRRPHQQWLCQELGITDQNYVDWLKALFMLFVERDKSEGDENSILAGMTTSLFEGPQRAVGVMICTYADPVCLVSDRAFSTSVRENGKDGFDFNLTSHAFIRYVFGQLDALVPHAPSWVVQGYHRPPKELLFHHRTDDMTQLGGYNRNVIYQCAQPVYSAIKMPVIPPME